MKKLVLISSVLILTNLFCFSLSAQTYNEILGRPTDSTITISILFNQAEELYWEYGTTSGTYPNTTAHYTASKNTPLVVDLTKLNPNTKYYYRARYRTSGSSSSFIVETEHAFQTQRAKGTTFTFDVEADEHLYDYGSPALYNITLNNEAQDKPDFLITLGDIFGDDHYPTTITSQDCDSLHLLYRSRLGTICHSIPFYICLGNHEGEKDFYLDSVPPNNLAVWSTIWRKYYYPNPYPNNFYSGNANVESYGIGLPEDYYAWTWGDALFVVLDVYRFDIDTTKIPKADWINSAKPGNWDWTLGFTQYAWLKNTLENSKAQYKFVFAHHVSGEARGGIVPAKLCEWGGYDKKNNWGFTTNRPGWDKPIHQLFVDNGVNIFFQGHDHLFAHEVLDSVTYQEVPMAADASYIKGMLANASAYTADTLDASGHLRVTVSPSNVKVDYVRAFLPADTMSGENHNQEISFSYSIINNTPTAINTKFESISLNVYPNPAKDKLTIILSDDLGSFQLNIINMLGQTILQSTLRAKSNNIDIGAIPDGVYILNLKTSNYEVNKKIIINR